MRLGWLAAVTASSCLFSSVVRADSLTGELALFYMTDNGARNLTDYNGAPYVQKTKTNYSFMSLGFCYRMNWACIGLKYVQGTIETRSSSSVNSVSATNTETYSGPGLTLGASVDEWLVHATLLVGAQKKITDKASAYGNSTTTGVRYPASSATLMDLGYGFKVGSVRVGPLLSILHMDYKKRIDGGTTETLPSKDSDDFIMPHLALWVDF